MPKPKEEPPEETREEETPSEDEEESPDPDESEEEASEEEGSEKEEEVEQFTDPNKVPPQLREAFRGMQAKYTKRMQALAQDVRYSEAFQELLRMPEFKQFADDLDNRRPYGYSSEFRQNGSDRSGKDEEREEDGDSIQVGEGKVSMKALAKALLPMLDQVISAKIAPLHDKEAARTLRQLERDDPDFDDYRPALTRLMRRHPTMTIEEAYELVSGKSSDLPKRPSGKIDKEAVEKGKKARTEGSGAARGSGVNTVTPKTAKTLREAIEWAAGQPGVRK